MGRVLGEVLCELAAEGLDAFLEGAYGRGRLAWCLGGNGDGSSSSSSSSFSFLCAAYLAMG